jgi:hypothetical protein
MYDSSWRIKTNNELDNLIKGRNIVNFIKAQRIYEWQPHARRKRGRPKIRWKDDVREDLKELGIYNQLTRTQDISNWKEIVEQAKAFKE